MGGGEEEGDSYFVKTDSVKPHDGIVGRYYEEVPTEGSFEINLYDDKNYDVYIFYETENGVGRGVSSSGTYTLNGNKLTLNGYNFNNEDVYIENGLIYCVEHQTSAIYRGEPNYDDYSQY